MQNICKLDITVTWPHLAHVGSFITLTDSDCNPEAKTIVGLFIQAMEVWMFLSRAICTNNQICCWTAVQWPVPPLNVYTRGARCKQNAQRWLWWYSWPLFRAWCWSSHQLSALLTYLLSKIHNVQDGLYTVLLTVSISTLGFISLFLFTFGFLNDMKLVLFAASQKARSASGSIFEGGVLLKLIVIYQTLNYS